MEQILPLIERCLDQRLQSNPTLHILHGCNQHSAGYFLHLVLATNCIDPRFRMRSFSLTMSHCVTRCLRSFRLRCVADITQSSSNGFFHLLFGRVLSRFRFRICNVLAYLPFCQATIFFFFLRAIVFFPLHHPLFCIAHSSRVTFFHHVSPEYSQQGGPGDFLVAVRRRGCRCGLEIS